MKRWVSFQLRKSRETVFTLKIMCFTEVRYHGLVALFNCSSKRDVKNLLRNTASAADWGRLR